MEKTQYGKNILKFIGVIYSIFASILFVLLVLAFSNLIPEVSEMVLIDYSYVTPSFYHSMSLFILLMAVVEIYLLFKAAKNPRKSTLLLVITKDFSLPILRT